MTVQSIPMIRDYNKYVEGLKSAIIDQLFQEAIEQFEMRHSVSIDLGREWSIGSNLPVGTPAVPGSYHKFVAGASTEELQSQLETYGAAELIKIGWRVDTSFGQLILYDFLVYQGALYYRIQAEPAVLAEINPDVLISLTAAIHIYLSRLTSTVEVTKQPDYPGGVNN